MHGVFGFQERITWMGTEVLTLAEVWPRRPKALIVGINPSQTSVDAGHYYQGKGARARIMLLVRAGLLDLCPGEHHFERAALAAEIGFTDLVRRPTPAATNLLDEELEYGKSALEAKMAQSKVPLVICIYAPPVRGLLGTLATPGYQRGLTSWGARVFNLPRPYLKREQADEIMATLEWD